jgi:hypothetical protein
MKYMVNIRPLPAVVMLILLQVGMGPVAAGVEEECRQEAQDYGLVAEEADDYISDCLQGQGVDIPEEMIPEGDADPFTVSDEQPLVGEESLSP